jgi:hypothetical protein
MVPRLADAGMEGDTVQVVGQHNLASALLLRPYKANANLIWHGSGMVPGSRNHDHPALQAAGRADQ